MRPAAGRAQSGQLPRNGKVHLSWESRKFDIFFIALEIYEQPEE